MRVNWKPWWWNVISFTAQTAKLVRLIPAILLLQLSSIAGAQTLPGLVGGLGETLGGALGEGLSEIALGADTLLLGGDGGDSAAQANEILLLGAPADSPLEGDSDLLSVEQQKKLLNKR